MRRILSRLCLVLTVASVCSAQSEQPLLLQKPTISGTHIAFVFAGDLWTVPRAGGDAQRLTTGIGIETDPHFSPDGNWIAFTGEYDGNVDVYVIAATGGVPRRLTYHPGADVAIGWTPDGKSVLFRSGRNSYSRFSRLFTISAEGGFPTELPLPMAEEGVYSPDGTRLAYLPLARAFQSWKRYRGGRATPIWIANLADSSVMRIPRKDSNDFNPMWLGERLYFLSDRNGPVTLFVYDMPTKQVIEVIKNTGFDLKSASATTGAIVYEQFGAIHLLDLRAMQSRKVDIRVAADLAEVRPRYEKVAQRIRSGAPSPTGVRAVFEARGDIFTVPVDKGTVRNLTKTSGVAERDPAWSPDGKWIAYFSDASGEYELHLRDQTGAGEPRKFKLGDAPSFYYAPTWSPDSKKIAYVDKRLNLWVLDLDKETNTRADRSAIFAAPQTLDPHWSPDSRWIVYTKPQPSRLRTVHVFSIDENKSYQITDGMSDTRNARFDKSGKYLFFTASTDTGLSLAGLDMTSYNRPTSRSVYLVVLRKDLPSPLAPESDEEKPQEATKAEGAKPPGEAASKAKPADTATSQVGIDLEGIGQRILALPIPARNYASMEAGKAGVLFLLEGAALGGRVTGGAPTTTLHKFDLGTRKIDRFLDGVTAFDVTANGEKLLIRQAERWAIVSASTPPAPGAGTLRVDDMECYVDPRAEWKQMFHEAWRIERDFFYDPNHHGLDLAAAERRYAPFVDSVASRGDLNYLFVEMLGELSSGHVYIQGGDLPGTKRVPGGLLGCDFKIENGRYRIARVYDGENWNPELRAPLTQPGVNVVAGEYLLGVRGREVKATDNVYSFFEATAGKPIVIKVGPNADGEGAREVTVVPVPSEANLRHLAWIEENRRKVDAMSGGKLAYVYLPDTGTGGYANFNRYFFAQVGREGAVIDERFNGGGSAADYIIDYLRRPLMSYWATRDWEPYTTPFSAIFGPKVMIVNEYAGSGGDLMPWMFRKAGVGPLVGKRTWGGLIGIGGYPPLIDGGSVTAPHFAFYNPNGEWEIENHGVAPDIEIEQDPKALRAGRDPQLEKAVEVALEALKKNPLPKTKRPAYPNYHKKP